MWEAPNVLQAMLDANTDRHLVATLKPPRREYLILFTARSGSSHLTDLLASAQVDNPKEWLNPHFIPGQAQAWGAGSFDEYFTRMRAKGSRRGIFGHEMTIWFYEVFSREVRLKDWFDFSAPTVMLFRENIVEQAVSLWFASVRQVYHDTGETDAASLPLVPYTPGEIRRCIELLAGEEERLRDFIVAHAMKPRYLSYEGLIRADPITVVQAFAGLVDAQHNASGITSSHRKLGSRNNLEQAHRFMEENATWCEALRSRRQWLFDNSRATPLL